MARALGVVCAVVLLSCVHPGESQCDVVRITAAVFEILQPLLDGIRSDIATLTEMVSQQNETLNDRMASFELSHLTEMVSQQNETLGQLNANIMTLAKDFEKHNNETESELANLGVSLQSVIDTPPIDAIGGAVVTKLLPYMNDMEADIKLDLEQLIREGTTFMSDTVNELRNTSIGLVSLLETHVNSTHMEVSSLDTKLESHMIEDLMCNVTDRISDTIEESEKQITDKLLEIKQDILEPFNTYVCGGTGGWRRVAYLNMTDLNTDCPSGWNMTEHSKRSCSILRRGCDSLYFSVSGGQYNRVCGRIRAYQLDIEFAFNEYNRLGYPTIDDLYFSGVAVMHGTPRQHIWTFAAGAWENNTRNDGFWPYLVCPCDLPYIARAPPFVGEDYFCESGYVYPNYGFHSNDTLWDGKDCHSTSKCCSFHNPPYFTKTLSETTTDNIELRMCNSFRESIAIELTEIYVKQDHIQSELQELDTQIKKSFVRQTNNINNLHVHTCGGTGGWRRAVYLDMTDPSTNCPSGWILTGDSKRTCNTAIYGYGTCKSVYFPVTGGPYSKVCGRIGGYQLGIPNAFHGASGSIDNAYFSGVAVMHGNPRQHIWTFAAGAWENAIRPSSAVCPCDSTTNITIPPFVGGDYFCESGYVYPGYDSVIPRYTLHSNDTLWDGKDCHSTSTCCSLHNPPYFTKTLTETTTDNLEMRMCSSNVAIELIELYVK